MTFHSILYENDQVRAIEQAPVEPDCFPDLNLDQVVNAMTAGKQAYNVKPFFYAALRDPDAIYYRQEVMRDLEAGALLAQVRSFAGKMVLVRRFLELARKLEFDYHKKGWFLEAALTYSDAITHLAHDLNEAKLNSRGLSALREYVMTYVNGAEFQAFREEAQAVKAGLSGIRYSVTIRPSKFSVRKFEDEPDYSVEVEKTFERFRQGAVKDHRVDLYQRSGMNYIEDQILNFVARLYPEQFAALDRFCSNHDPFVDETIRTFDREVQFYVAYLDYVAEMKQKGLPFCYPQVGATSRAVRVRDAFDLALARLLLRADKPVITNDFCLHDPERIIVVSGPNQGGKTTFARMFGQLHYMASLGCPVPGREAQLGLFDRIFTHFEKEEDIANLRGKLQDDLVRIHDILAHATSQSILIVNEIFASTTLQDAVFLSKEIMQQVMQLDALCVWVTFMDELASLSDKTISMVSTADPENPAVRTFKIVRKPADGLAYALSIAEKYRLTGKDIEERIPS